MDSDTEEVPQVPSDATSTEVKVVQHEDEAADRGKENENEDVAMEMNVPVDLNLEVMEEEEQERAVAAHYDKQQSELGVIVIQPKEETKCKCT